MSIDITGRIRARLGGARETVADGAAGLVNEVGTLFATIVSFSLLGRRLGPSDYGSLVAMYSLIGIAICIAYIGPGLAMLQAAMGANLRAVAGHFFSEQMLFSGLAFGVVVVLAPVLVPAVPLTTFLMFLIAELVGTALVTLAANLRIVASGFRSAVKLQLIPQIIKVVVIAALAIDGRLTLASYGLVYMVCSMLAGVSIFITVTRTLGIVRRPKAIKGEHVRTTLSISSTIWAMGLHDSGDKLVMSANRLGADVGLYAAAYRLLSLGNIPVNALATSSYRSFLDPAVGNQKRRALQFSLLATLYTVCAAIGVILLAPIALPILVGDKFDGSITMARWLAPLLITRPWIMFASNALAGLDRVHARFLAHCTSAAVGMVVYIALIPSMSWRGAIIGSYVTDLVLIAAMWIILVRTNPAPMVHVFDGMPIQPEEHHAQA